MTEHPSAGMTEILAAAARAFAEHGFHGMSMRDLAKLTKRAPATLYNYVDCKEDLLYLIQRDAFDEMLAAAQDALDGLDDPSERLHEFVLNHVRFFANRQYLMRVLIHEAAALPASRRNEIRDRKERYFAIAREIVAAVAESRGDDPNPLDVERNTYCLFGMLNWTYGWYEPRRHGSPEELAETIERVANFGVSAAAAPKAARKKLRSDNPGARHTVPTGGVR
ncbi:MAG: TetR family transcriptional regulator [Myxococcales bacterium]|nr:TetR family transcriptional regulator [Myxococcales bacterium]